MADENSGRYWVLRRVLLGEPITNEEYHLYPREREKVKAAKDALEAVGIPVTPDVADGILVSLEAVGALENKDEWSQSLRERQVRSALEREVQNARKRADKQAYYATLGSIAGAAVAILGAAAATSNLWAGPLERLLSWLGTVLGIKAHAAEALSSNPTIAQFIPYMVLVIFGAVILFFAYAAWASIYAKDRSSRDTARGWVKDIMAFFVGVVLGKVL